MEKSIKYKLYIQTRFFLSIKTFANFFFFWLYSKFNLYCKTHKMILVKVLYIVILFFSGKVNLHKLRGES